IPIMPSKKISEERKLASRNKEKKRNIDINEAFVSLQNSFSAIPFITRRRKVPKVKMLRLAIKYIDHLERILHNEQHVSWSPLQRPSPYCPPRPLKMEDFENIAAEEFNERNSYTNRLHEDDRFAEICQPRSHQSKESTDSSTLYIDPPNLTPIDTP
ncbi:hypothetical protein PFISCL1PPCAC_19338, partial [Pristionchus fissidentatus]